MPDRPTPDPIALAGLLERVRAATGPDRELDILLAVYVAGMFDDDSVVPFLREQASRETSHGNPRFEPDPDHTQADRFGVPRYTASLDAALALVGGMLPEWEYEVYGGGKPGSEAVCVLEWPSGYVLERRRIYPFEGRAPTTPMAVLAALLSVLTHQSEAAHVE